MAEEIRVPDIGDFDAVEVIEILAGAGDEVTADDPLVVIESDKASMEIPAGVAGVVESILVSLGDQVSEGSVIATIGATSEGAAPAAEGGTASAAEAAAAEPAAAEPAAAEPAAAEPAAAEPEPAAAPASAPASAPAAEQAVEVRVPDIGDASGVVVIEVGVAPGQEVGPDDLLVVVESDKASMEIPAGLAGTVEAVHVDVGTEVEEGSLLVTLKAEPAAPAVEAPATVEAPTAPAAEALAAPAPEAVAAPAALEPSATPDRGAATRVYAGPAVRRLARELGVDLSAVTGSGSRGRILKDDVKAFVKTELSRPGAAAGALPPVPQVDFAKFGPVETLPLSRIRAAGATNLHRSWVNLPHVTQHEEADVTELEAFRRSLKEEAAREGVKVTPLAFIIKACCYALKEFPTFNASLDAEAKNFILKRYYHIGFAVDTEEGLVVPVIRDADKLGIWELSRAVAELADKARAGKLGMGDVQGGTFSISSLGNIGGTGFTPIINAPEVAILGVSRLVTKPVWDGAAFQPRQMLPLSLSYDHRAINGAEAGRFMAELAALLGDIRRLAL